MKRSTLTLSIAALAVLALAACSQPPTGSAPTTPANAATVAAPHAPVISAPPASASTAGLPGDHANTSRYKIAIALPTLTASEKPLADALRATADNAKREFLQALPDPQQGPESSHHPFEMLLTFQVVAQTAAFVSVRETGMQDTGGAHPLPVDATFVFSRSLQRVITLDDLFANPDAARKTLATFARPALAKGLLADAPKPGEGSPKAIEEWKTNTLQMIHDGTTPTTVNFSQFVIRAGATADAASPGLTLMFPPYQVAPYAAGTRTVDVPASVFATYLKPAYQGDFTPQ